MEKLYYIWLSEAIGAEPMLFSRLNAAFSSVSEIYGAREEELSSLSLKKSILKRLLDKDIEKARLAFEFCRRNDISVITYGDGKYPPSLREIAAPPPVLFVRGNVSALSRYPKTACVGTRKTTEYGMTVAYNIGRSLALCGSTVVSGAALGSDGMALAGALDGMDSPIAVLGCGVDIAYPSCHASLLSEIAERGAVISEFLPGTAPAKESFPRRNRIISALSDITAVIDGEEHGGAMITAAYAIEQGKPLYAVPGQVMEKKSSGTNLLIKKGAKPLLSASDILSEYLFLYPGRISLERAAVFSSEDARLSARAHRIGLPSNLSEEAPMLEKEDKKPVIRRKSNTSADCESGITVETVGSLKELPEVQAALSRVDGNTKELFMALPDIDFSPDEVAKERSVSDVLCALTVLEINGIVESLPGGRYRICKK